MSIELLASLSAVFVALGGGFFNYYKLKDDQKTWEEEQKISINKKILFRILKKRFKHYSKIFVLLGKVRDIDYPKEHYLFLENNKIELLKIADQILLELYGTAGLFMSYETRSQLLKTYQCSYRYANNEVNLNELVDSYYVARRCIRQDLEFDDSKTATSSKKILDQSLYGKKEVDKYEVKWAKKGKIAYSSRPGYPNKVVSHKELSNAINLWKKSGIKSIICLLSDKEIKEYYEIIDNKLIEFYTKNSFVVLHVSIEDFSKPIINNKQLDKIFTTYKDLKEPILIHCGAGIDRTGFLLESIDKRFGNK